MTKYKFALFTVAGVLVFVAGFLVGQRKQETELTGQLEAEKARSAYERQRFEDNAGVLSEQVRRIQKAYDTNDGSIRIHISTLAGCVRHAGHLPAELHERKEP